MTSEELLKEALSCPFCDGPPYLRVSYLRVSSNDPVEWVTCGNQNCPGFREEDDENGGGCGDCYDADAAIAIWNRRTRQKSAEVVALRVHGPQGTTDWQDAKYTENGLTMLEALQHEVSFESNKACRIEYAYAAPIKREPFTIPIAWAIREDDEIRYFGFNHEDVCTEFELLNGQGLNLTREVIALTEAISKPLTMEPDAFLVSARGRGKHQQFSTIPDEHGQVGTLSCLDAGMEVISAIPLFRETKLPMVDLLRLKKAGAGLINAMEMQENRQTGALHLTPQAARFIWDEAKDKWNEVTENIGQDDD